MFHRNQTEKGRFFHSPVEGVFFHRNFFLFQPLLWKTYLLELMFVLISFTRSEKEGSFFICFSTCLME